MFYLCFCHACLRFAYCKKYVTAPPGVTLFVGRRIRRFGRDLARRDVPLPPQHLLYRGASNRIYIKKRNRVCRVRECKDVSFTDQRRALWNLHYAPYLAVLQRVTLQIQGCESGQESNIPHIVQLCLYNMRPTISEFCLIVLSFQQYFDIVSNRLSLYTKKMH